MARNSKGKQSWERYDETRLREAIKEIANSQNLRYFVRNFLGSSGVYDVFPSENALSMARAAGRHELGMTMLATINLHQPDLWPRLLLEEQHELAQRNLSPEGYERADGGDTSGDSIDTNFDTSY